MVERLAKNFQGSNRNTFLPLLSSRAFRPSHWWFLETSSTVNALFSSYLPRCKGWVGEMGEMSAGSCRHVPFPSSSCSSPYFFLLVRPVTRNDTSQERATCHRYTEILFGPSSCVDEDELFVGSPRKKRMTG